VSEWSTVASREDGDNPRMLDAMREGDRVTYIVGKNGSIGSVEKIERKTA